MRRRRSSSIRLGVAQTQIGWSHINNVSVSEVLEQVDFSGEFDTASQFPDLKQDKLRRRRRTKIVCAIGPASRSVEMLVQLLESGMNVARLNFSHGDHDYHFETLQNIRAAVRILNNRGAECHCAILMDTKGPEIRTGFLENNEPVQLRRHQELEICTDYEFLGNSKKIACSYSRLCESVKLGNKILIADGAISTEIVKVLDNRVIVKVGNDAILEERKNMNLPGVCIRLPGITEKDRFDIEHFALKHKVDIVSGSFIRSAANVRALRQCLGEKGKNIRVHAKIESVEGLQNIDEILEEADGVHVSRGDLGMELELSKLFLAQKGIIHWANLQGKPVVTSTQMLDSMTKHPRPTNAECSDVANAVLDGTDCMMLSAETAKGLYPQESVETMARIIAEAELAIDFDSHFISFRDQVLKKGRVDVMEALASTAVETAMSCDAPVIVLFTESGRLAMLVAKYRPLARILVVTANSMVARQMSVSRGVSALRLSQSDIFKPRVAWKRISRFVTEKRGWANSQDRIILVGSIYDANRETLKSATLDPSNRNNPRLTNCVEIRVLD